MVRDLCLEVFLSSFWAIFSPFVFVPFCLGSCQLLHRQAGEGAVLATHVPHNSKVSQSHKMKEKNVGISQLGKEAVVTQLAC